MSAKKQDKSSKTAHVLNLLTKPTQAAAPAPLQDTAEAPAPAAGQAAASLVPPIVQSVREQENLSEQIRGALADDLADDLAAALAETPADDSGEAYFEAYDDLTEGIEGAAAVPENAVPEKIVPENVFPENIKAPQPQPEAAAPAPAPAPAPEPAPVFVPTIALTRAPVQHTLVYLNIMQPLVEAAAPRYIKMFGVCDCPRCQADVRAYALTHLKPHYAVYRQEDSIPMLTLYETRYASQVATILTQACEVVKENPRHRYRY